ncbi:hypothetical protein Q7P37_000629 [Cladosporium fusiforme]
MADTSKPATPDASQDAQPQTEQPAAGSGEALNDDQVLLSADFLRSHRSKKDTNMDDRDSTTTTSLAPSEASEKPEMPPHWVKVFWHKNEAGQEYYFTHVPSGESTYEEPNEEFYLYDWKTKLYHVSGLQKPTPKETLEEEQRIREEEQNPMNYDDPRPRNGWQGYKGLEIDGPWDPNGYYMAYHNWLAKLEEDKANPQAAATDQTYASSAQFNAQTGRYQTADQSADRYDSSNRAGRQMNHFFDVDSAANAHDGRSLKEERRAMTHSKKEIAEMNQKRKDKKHQKRMAFLKS